MLLLIGFYALLKSAKAETDPIVVIGTDYSYGTGFVVQSKNDISLIVTAGHILKKNDTHCVVAFNTLEERDAFVVKRDTIRDLVLLVVYNAPHKKPLKLLRAELPAHTKVHTIGHPDFLLYTRTIGIIQNNTRENKGCSLYQLQLPIAGGASGSPVMKGNRVIGMLVSYQDKMPTTSFAVQSKEIIDFLKKN
jgi:hypothetical protein